MVPKYNPVVSRSTRSICVSCVCYELTGCAVEIIAASSAGVTMLVTLLRVRLGAVSGRKTVRFPPLTVHLYKTNRRTQEKTRKVR